MRTIDRSRPSPLPTALTVLLALTVSACGGSGDATPDGSGTMGEPGSPDGPMLVAADVGFAPHAMVLPDGSVEGFNIDMAAEIARRLGRPGYEIVDQEWSGMFPGLSAGRFEWVIAPVTMTYERSEEVLFIEGYLDTDYTFVIQDDAPEIQSLEDIRGQAIAVNNGSAYDIWATENQDAYDLEIQRYGKNADAVQAVVTGRAFANLAGESVARWAAQQSPMVRTTLTIPSGAKFSAAFRHDDVEMRNRVELALECMKADGTMARIHERWLGATPAEGSASITVLEGYGEPGMLGHDPSPHPLECG